MASVLRSDLDFGMGSSLASPSVAMPLGSSSDLLESFSLSMAYLYHCTLATIGFNISFPLSSLWH
ncbi:hypothetical protein GmHk_10G030532 [Glycine max]|nr:hypothetical protein GmHk_10G030532 [Glycine max]